MGLAWRPVARPATRFKTVQALPSARVPAAGVLHCRFASAKRGGGQPPPELGSPVV